MPEVRFPLLRPSRPDECRWLGGPAGTTGGGIIQISKFPSTSDILSPKKKPSKVAIDVYRGEAWEMRNAVH